MTPAIVAPETPLEALSVSLAGTFLEALANLIRDRVGLVLHDHQFDSLRTATADACRRFSVADGSALLERLRGLPGDAPEWEYLISRVTIGESYFFRDEGQISFLRDEWLPRFAAEKRRDGSRTLRIWCAGCSTGQEPYTIAMLLQDGLIDLPRWDVRILATDINADGLRTGVAARYSEWSFRATPPDVRARFFFPDGKDFVLNERTRTLVNFEYLNLVGDSFPSLTNHTAGQDLIVCRNVFIYFDRPTVRAVMEKFAQCLRPGGTVLVGAADPVATDNRGLVYRPGTLTGSFVRAEDEPASARLGTTARPRPRGAQAPRPISSVAAPVPPVGPPAAAEAQSTPDFKDVIARLHASDWAGALTLIETLQDAGENSDGLRRAKGKVLANMGRLAKAAEECEALAAQGSTDKHTYYLLGLIEVDRGDLPAATTAFRRALFLDRTFVEAHYQLGLIECRTNNREAAAKHFRNALTLAEAAPPDQVLHEAGDMTMHRLVDVLHQSLGTERECGR